MDEIRWRVAHAIMGWTKLEVRNGKLLGHSPESCGEESGLKSLPDYPNDIGAAWSLVEEMDRNGFACDVSLSTYSPIPVVSFAKGDLLAVEYECPNLPEAICRASLKAVANS